MPDIEMTDNEFWSRIEDVEPEIVVVDWIPEDVLALQQVCEDAIAREIFFTNINFLTSICNN